MFIQKALLALVGAAAAVHAFPGRANQELPRRGAKEGGIERFEIVKASMSPGDMLARSGAPFYSGNDKSQKITPETIAFFKEAGIQHVISLNSDANAAHMKESLSAAGIAYTPRPVEDFEVPTPEDFQKGWEAFVAHRNGTLVWCGFGWGRTGTMVSALQIQAQHERGEALAFTNSDYTKNHVETDEQKAALNELQERLKKSAAPSTVAPAPAAVTGQPSPKEMEDALCAPADKPNKYGLTEADCRIQVAQCGFEVSKLGPLSNFDPIVACMDKKFLKAASARAIFV
ncbi:galactonate dehydratase [Cordyceps militaris]|uniref:Galactonate dehydratase n=1 Tax=Cordyceps militaris TaxID=73501 RepID=A0A2H4SSV7_CORMI|nr:galactonate dehydratase [Cordyceps militaris]